MLQQLSCVAISVLRTLHHAANSAALCWPDSSDAAGLYMVGRQARPPFRQLSPPLSDWRLLRAGVSPSSNSKGQSTLATTPVSQQGSTGPSSLTPKGRDASYSPALIGALLSTSQNSQHRALTSAANSRGKDTAALADVLAGLRWEHNSSADKQRRRDSSFLSFAIGSILESSRV